MTIRIFTGFILGIQVLVFTMLPYYYSKTFSNKKIINALNNLIAGLFLGIAFLHIIPQSNYQISQYLQTQVKDISHFNHITQTQYKPKIQYGTLISLITFLIVLGIQVYLNDGIQINVTQKRNNNHMYDVISNQKLKMRRRLILQTYLTQLALSIHSLFQCMSIGIQTNQKVIYGLAGAIIFHKWAQALMLGISYSTAGMTKQEALKYAIFHCFLNIIPVFVGYYLSSTSDLVKGITNGISGGTFIYISMIQKISKSFVEKDQLFAKLGLIFIGIVFSLLLLN